ncbi:protein JTB [Episyrphus balteatus]|uniref:protein JTB n=1 Tax=Episyrphus balteatus TaxID=286459 RepID=UPI002486653F|nr:protein JTB [Episyrphus balteatus]
MQNKSTMLEGYPKNRMFMGLGILVACTIIVIIIESNIDVHDHNFQPQIVIENNSTCWLREEYQVIEECHPCTEFEVVSKSLGVCINTHYKEVLRCKSGEIVTRSCDHVAEIERRNLIIFTVVCGVLGFLSYMLVYWRERVIYRRAQLKIERQLNRPLLL